MMDVSLSNYVVPSGKLLGRTLGSLSAHEKQHLRRTRQQVSQEARALLKRLDLKSAAGPSPRLPMPEREADQPAVCVPMSGADSNVGPRRSSRRP